MSLILSSKYVSRLATTVFRRNCGIFTGSNRYRKLRAIQYRSHYNTSMSSTVEAFACKVDDMKDGEMKQIGIGEGHALLVRENGEYTAVGHKCTHFGAPLVKGSLVNGIVRCPWHGACFNTKTGDIEDFPGLDNIPKFETRIENDFVIVRANIEDLKSHKKVAEMCQAAPKEDSRTFLLIGGGAASVECAETLRKNGFKGKIVITTQESLLPYDRTLLSKMLKKKGEDIVMRSQEFYDKYNIEVKLNKEASKLDLASRSVVFADGSTMKYDKLFIGSGGKPTPMQVAGADLENVCYLRTPSDANAIAAACEGKKLVVIGTSFIGLEVAAFGVGKIGAASSVDVIGRSPTPFATVFGKVIGERFVKLHEEKGVKFHFNATVKEFRGSDGKLEKVILNNGEELEADVCVVGIGVKASTNFAKDCGLPMTKTGSITVDKYLQASDGVYAGGDIASFPLKMLKGEHVTIGHWQLAHAHGKAAALNMLGRNQEVTTVPYFWTMQFGKSLRYAGHAGKFDDVFIDGNVEELKFVAYYIKGDKVLAVATMGSDPVASHAANLLFEGTMPSASEIRANPSKWHSSVST